MQSSYCRVLRRRGSPVRTQRLFILISCDCHCPQPPGNPFTLQATILSLHSKPCCVCAQTIGTFFLCDFTKPTALSSPGLSGPSHLPKETLSMLIHRAPILMRASSHGPTVAFKLVHLPARLYVPQTQGTQPCLPPCIWHIMKGLVHIAKKYLMKK